jgi:mono/diheme cytochrome c family protein
MPRFLSVLLLHATMSHRFTFHPFAALAFLLLGCGEPEPKREWTAADHGQPQMPPEPDVAQAGESASDEPPGDQGQRAVRALWSVTCAGCHGRDGRGQGEGRPPGAQLPDFTLAAWQSSRADQQLAQVIRDGRGMMPAFGKRVSDEGIAALVRFIRVLGAGAEPEPTTAPRE